MIDLAFDSNGEPFELPATAAFWRVRRFRRAGVRGGPEVVFGQDGSPLILSIDTDLVEFREQVGGVPGRYRLDPLDQRQQPVADVPAAYLQISDPPKTTPAEDQTSVIRELVRANAEMTKTIAEKFASVMQSAADLIRAADGAGLPARTPPVVETRNAGATDDEDDEADEEPRSQLAEIIKQVMPLVQIVVTKMLNAHISAETRNTAVGPAGGERRESGRREETGQGSAHEVGSAAQKAATGPARGERHETGRRQETGEGSAREAASPGQRDVLAHLRAVEGALTAAEVDLVRRAMMEMSPEVLQAWAAKLCALSVDEAVQAVRAEMAEGGGS
jgi:hypothetical protein